MTPDREPTSLGAVVLNNLRFSASGAVGFGVALVVSGAFLKTDYLFPFAAGAVSTLWGIVLRLVGILGGPAFDLGLLVYGFGWTFVAIGSMVLGYRILRNKVVGLSLGMAIGA